MISIKSKRQQRALIPSRLEKCGLGSVLRSLCVYIACVKINSEERRKKKKEETLFVNGMVTVGAV